MPLVDKRKKHDKTETTAYNEDDTERDEVLEVRRVAQKDTYNVRLWRFAMTGVLLLTAVAVTFTTYKLLKREQYSAFETAVSDNGILERVHYKRK